MSERDESTTEGLARRAAQPDPEAFAALVARVRGRLRLWVAARMGPLLRARVSVDDVLQESYLQAYRSLADFREQGPGSFRRWMLGVAGNRLRDLHKHHAALKRDQRREVQGPRDPEERSLLATLAASGPSPSSGAGRAEQAEKLAGSIAALPEELADVLLARVVEECTFEEIGRRMRKSAAVARGLYARALAALRSELGG